MAHRGKEGAFCFFACSAAASRLSVAAPLTRHVLTPNRDGSLISKDPN